LGQERRGREGDRQRERERARERERGGGWCGDSGDSTDKRKTRRESGTGVEEGRGNQAFE